MRWRPPLVAERRKAFKAVVYASTASWVAGIGQVLPWVSVLVLLAGGVYSIYLLYLGLPQTMKCPPEKAAGYTAVTFVIAIVLSWLISFAVGGVIGVGSMRGSGLPGVSDSGDAGGFDEDSAMGKLESMARQAEEAGKKMEAAQKSGDVQAQRDAAGEIMSAVAGGGAQVESLAPDRIKPFVPESLAGCRGRRYRPSVTTPWGCRSARHAGLTRTMRVVYCASKSSIWAA